MSLSERQINAAHRLGQDVCVVAGPGSGKTSVLIERFTWLVSRTRCRPGPHPRDHVHGQSRHGDQGADGASVRRTRPRSASRSSAHMFRRFMASARGLLRENAIVAGIDPQFQVLEQPGKLLRQVADEVLESIYSEQPDRMRRFLRSLAVIGEGKPVGSGSCRVADRDL